MWSWDDCKMGQIHREWKKSPEWSGEKWGVQQLTDVSDMRAVRRLTSRGQKSAAVTRVGSAQVSAAPDPAAVCLSSLPSGGCSEDDLLHRSSHLQLWVSRGSSAATAISHTGVCSYVGGTLSAPGFHLHSQPCCVVKPRVKFGTDFFFSDALLDLIPRSCIWILPPVQTRKLRVSGAPPCPCLPTAVWKRSWHKGPFLSPAGSAALKGPEEPQPQQTDTQISHLHADIKARSSAAQMRICRRFYLDCSW